MVSLTKMIKKGISTFFATAEMYIAHGFPKITANFENRLQQVIHNSGKINNPREIKSKSVI